MVTYSYITVSGTTAELLPIWLPFDLIDAVLLIIVRIRNAKYWSHNTV